MISLRTEGDRTKTKTVRETGTMAHSGRACPTNGGGGGQGAEFGPPGPSKERDFTVCLQHQRGGWDGDGIGRFPKFVCQTGLGTDPGSVRGGKGA